MQEDFQEDNNEEEKSSINIVASLIGLIAAIFVFFSLLIVVVVIATTGIVANQESEKTSSRCSVDFVSSDKNSETVSIPEDFKEPIREASKISGLPEEIIAAQINAESGFSTDATSHVGAQGPAQFMPATWQQWGDGGDPREPDDAMRAYGRYMKHLLSLAQGWQTESGPDAAQLAVAAYNAGEGAPGLSEGQLPPYEETQQYVKKIFRGAQVDFSKDCKRVGAAASEIELGDGEWAKVLPGGSFTSGYGYRNLIPGCAPGDMSLESGCFANMHMGVDLATGAGTGPGGTVHAPTDGEIVCLPGREGMLQMRVQNDKDSEMLISFYHTDSQLVKVGDKIRRGDPIAVEGNKGFSMGTHLHVEIMKPGAPDCAPPMGKDPSGKPYNVDPEPILREKGAM